MSADEERRLTIRHPHGEWVERDLVRVDAKVITLDGETYELSVCGSGPDDTLFSNTIRDTPGCERLLARLEFGPDVMAKMLKGWAADGVCHIDDRHVIPWARVKKVEKTSSPYVRRWYVVTEDTRTRPCSRLVS